MNRRVSIGFDRRLNLEWLDAAAAQAATGASPQQMRAYLWGLLDGVVSGSTSGGARRKTVTVLNHIWGDVPPTALQLRERAIQLLASCTSDERLALHWAMMLGTYSVFADTASTIGRLLALQESFSLAHVMRRLTEAWGERSTLERAIQRIVRSMVQWGVLGDATTRGTYVGAPKKVAIRPSIGILFVEALLIDAGTEAAPLDHLSRSPALFPFDVSLNEDSVHSAPYLRLHREGLDVTIVELVPQ